MKPENKQLAPRKITPQHIEHLAAAIGIDISQGEFEDAADRLQQMFDFEDELGTIDLEGVAPAAVFDPSWSTEQE